MRIGILAAVCLVIWTACSTYEKKDLYGVWKGSTWNFTFNEDGSCTCGQNAAEFPCTYRTPGNSLEINATAFQLTNITVKSIKGDTLKIEMRELGTAKEHVLIRQ